MSMRSVATTINILHRCISKFKFGQLCQNMSMAFEIKLEIVFALKLFKSDNKHM